MESNMIVRKVKKPLIILACFLIVGAVGFMAYRASQFHIVKTDPDTANMPAVAPYLRVYFNDKINASSFEYTDDPTNIISSVDTGEKDITFHFTKNLTKDIQYVITIDQIKNIDGEAIIDKQITFVPKDIPFTGLSEQQQKTLVNRQDERLYELNSINYTNFGTLLDYGITAGQLENIKLSIYNYSIIVDKKFWNITVDPNSITISNHDPESSSSQTKADFTVTLEDTTYRLHAEYELLYDSVYVQLYDAGNNLAYDSADGGQHTED